MKFRGSSNWQGFFIWDEDTGITVRSEKYADSWKIRPHVPVIITMNPAEQASLEDAMEIDEISKWHATEHKLINLLMSGRELTLKNLKTASMIHPDCGIRNRYLKEPEDGKLQEAINVGLKYLRLKNLLVLKK